MENIELPEDRYEAVREAAREQGVTPGVLRDILAAGGVYCAAPVYYPTYKIIMNTNKNGYKATAYEVVDDGRGMEYINDTTEAELSAALSTLGLSIALNRARKEL
jgi:hypothetical protein